MLMTHKNICMLTSYCLTSAVRDLSEVFYSLVFHFLLFFIEHYHHFFFRFKFSLVLVILICFATYFPLSALVKISFANALEPVKIPQDNNIEEVVLVQFCYSYIF